MSSRRPELDRASVVLVGHFNPAIFQPAWLAEHGLIRREEAEQAKGLVFSPEVAAFTADWLVVQVTSDRFEAYTDDAAHAAPLRDLVLSIFRLLEHTPFDKMGMNRNLHYRVESEERWHRLGDRLAPKEVWRPVLDNPGLRSMTVWGAREGAPSAVVQVIAEPSTKVRPGLYVSTNEHHEQKEANSARELMKVLERQWESMQNYAISVADTLLGED